MLKPLQSYSALAVAGGQREIISSLLFERFFGKNQQIFPLLLLSFREGRGAVVKGILKFRVLCHPVLIEAVSIVLFIREGNCNTRKAHKSA